MKTMKAVNTMKTMQRAVMVLVAVGMGLGLTGCVHNRNDDDDDDRPQAFDQVGEVKVFDERPKVAHVKSAAPVAVKRVQFVATKQVQRFDQIGEADIAE